MVNYSLNFVRLLLNDDARTVDVKHEAEVAYTNEMQNALKNTVWRSGCSSWYFTENGWNSTVYPFSQVDFWRRCTWVKWNDWNIEYTSKGLAKLRLRKLLKTLAFVLAIGGAWKLRSSGLGVAELKELARGVVQSSLAKAMQTMNRIQNAVL